MEVGSRSVLWVYCNQNIFEDPFGHHQYYYHYRGASYKKDSLLLMLIPHVLHLYLRSFCYQVCVIQCGVLVLSICALRFSPEASLFPRFRLRDMSRTCRRPAGTLPYTTAHVWAQRGLRGMCSGRPKKLRELGSFSRDCGPPRRAEQNDGNPQFQLHLLSAARGLLLYFCTQGLSPISILAGPVSYTHLTLPTILLV